MGRSEQFAELAALIDALLDDRGDAEQLARLQELVEQCPDARRFYIDALHQHASLQWDLDRVPSPIDSTPAEAVAVQPPLDALRAVAPWRVGQSPLPFSISVAVLVMGLLIAAMALVAPPIYRHIAEGDGGSAAPQFVATLAAAYQPVWAQGQVGVERGSSLKAGQRLELREGLAELTYTDGVSVILHGPVIYVVDQPGSGQLESGRITVRVPRPAVGFAVATKFVTITDLGTEFGVELSGEGDETKLEVAVFQGQIELAASAADGQRRWVQRIDQNGSAVVMADRPPTVSSRIESDQFVRTLPGADPAEPAVVHRGALRVFRGADELDFRGDFALAVNAGGGDAHTIGDASLQADDGSLMQSENAIVDWGPRRPEYGDTRDDDALEAVMRSVRYDRDRMPGTIDISIPLPPGDYQVQLLFSDNYSSHTSALWIDRGWIAIQIENATVVERLRILAEQKIEPSAQIELPRGLAFTDRVRVDDGQLDIRISGTRCGDPRVVANPILNALTVERLRGE